MMRELEYYKWLDADIMGVDGGKNMYLPSGKLIMTLYALPVSAVSYYAGKFEGSVHIHMTDCVGGDALIHQKYYATLQGAKRGAFQAAKRILEGFYEGIVWVADNPA